MKNYNADMQHKRITYYTRQNVVRVIFHLPAIYFHSLTARENRIAWSWNISSYNTLVWKVLYMDNFVKKNISKDNYKTVKHESGINYS